MNGANICVRLAASKGTKMNSPVVKRSIVVAGHKTSVSLEDAFWQGLKEIVRSRRTTLSDVVADLDMQRSERSEGNLSSAIRLFVLDHFRARVPLVSGPSMAGAEMQGQPLHV
jgi:predicted DNA-binding ribbon-helix-helix protein